MVHAPFPFVRRLVAIVFSALAAGGAPDPISSAAPATVCVTAYGTCAVPPGE
jgi:hypothetical protein